MIAALLTAAVTLTMTVAPPATPMDPTTTLWYSAPAHDWNHALPVGNGFLGAMVFGGVAQERLQVNDGTFWGGRPTRYTRDGAHRHLAEIQRRIFADDEAGATDLAGREFMGEPKFQAAYQPLVDLGLEFSGLDGEVEGYARRLDLDTGIHTTTFRHGGTTFVREVYASHPDRVLVVRLTADRPGAISVRAGLTSPFRERVEALDGHTLVARGKWRDDGIQKDWIFHAPGDGIRFAAAVRGVAEGGRVTAGPDHLVVEGADSATLILATGTSFVDHDDIGGDPDAVWPDRLAEAAGRGEPALRERHRQDHGALMARVRLRLPATPASGRPTDERLGAVRAGGVDPALDALIFQFGRYLLASSSRPGGQPANLQGIWNKDTWPAWGSKYTTNINLQMNYWPAETANLAECAAPLWDLIDDLQVTGADVAREHYAARGWVLHHNTDLWRGAAPVDGVWGVWPMGAAWLARHPWEHYRYSGDESFLRERAWPAMRGAARFVLDFLVEAPAGSPVAGRLVTNPSHSPENTFIRADGTASKFTYAATMDLQIVRDLLENCRSAMDVLGLEDAETAAFRAEVDAALARLAPVQVSPTTGRLQEWVEDYREPEPGHRHVSHLYALFPGDGISPHTTPDLAAAARRSLDHRLANGGGGTGWSRGWLVNLFARLADGDEAHRQLQRLLAASTQPNLLNSHPPFQIDGNFAATSGVAEMLLQSHHRGPDGLPRLELLPALPAAWAEGSASGLRARGGFEVSLTWRAGRLTGAEVASRRGGACVVAFGGEEHSVDLAPGAAWRWSEPRAADAALDLGARVQPISAEAGFAEPGYFVWCGAPVRTPDGKIHLYYSRWKREHGFMAWATKSEIAHAVADAPEGPFRFVDVALPARGDAYWDGDCTHNPYVLTRDGRFYLYYMGNRGDGTYVDQRNRQRIGVAVADRPEGPWRRFDHPIVDVDPDPRAFDSLLTSNPAVGFWPDGRTLLIYKAVALKEGVPMGGNVRFGAAVADRPEGPFRKVRGRIFEGGNGEKTWMVAEDPFIWHDARRGNRWYAVVRDVEGEFAGEAGGLALFESTDGLDWRPSDRPRVLGAGYPLVGGGRSPDRVERPFLLFDADGEPIALFGATDGYERGGRISRNVCLPLRKPVR